MFDQLLSTDSTSDAREKKKLCSCLFSADNLEDCITNQFETQHESLTVMLSLTRFIF